jgi:hypothetical protein
MRTAILLTSMKRRVEDKQTMKEGSMPSSHIEKFEQ